MQRPPGIGNAVSRRLCGLDRRLGIDHSDRSEWVWAVPLLTFVGTLALFLILQRTSGISLAVAAPVGLVCAVVMAGMSVAYMTPVADQADGDDGPGHDDGRVPALPGGWWETLTGPTPQPAERASVDASTVESDHREPVVPSAR
ncbi:MAG: hypothetical protein JWM18_3994 [Chloroflexi bacterium]|jgi:hypothetical protein|nr:hypothetical protein [Chloroflexota bacterium]